MIDEILLSCQKSCQCQSCQCLHRCNVGMISDTKVKFCLSQVFRVRKPHEYNRSKRLIERKHKKFLQLNDKDFKNLSGDHQRTNIIWEVQNNE